MQPLSQFTIDEQTFSDLDIFTENAGSAAIWNLFKGTRTLGGREMLRQFMTYPLTDHRLLKARTSSIKYFYQNPPAWELDNAEIDLIEFYLKSDKRLSKQNLVDSIADHFTRNSSQDYYNIRIGLRYLIKLARNLLALTDLLDAEDLPDQLREIFTKIRDIIRNGGLQDAIHYKEEQLKFHQVNRLDASIRGKDKPQISTLMLLVYELDVYETVALKSKTLGFNFARYKTGQQMYIKLEGLFHPGITKAVDNDFLFDGSKNIVFLTGANMAGKSSFLKALGLAVYLAHLGFPVPARAMDTTVFNGLVTTINLPDSTRAGLSHYYSEVRRVKDVALKLARQERLLIIFDELFRGTNVKDAFDASRLIISELSRIHSAAFLISTHIVELADALATQPNISFCCMRTGFEKGRPFFSYKLEPGVSKDRLGMYIVENEGIVEVLRSITSAKP